MIALAVLACLLPASAPAFASGSFGGGSSPPAQGNGGYGSGGSGKIVCGPGGTGVGDWNGQAIYGPVFPRCNPGGYYRYTNMFADRYCLVGFEVFRFYGIQGQSPSAWTRSQIGLPSWCTSSASAMMFAPNPQDAGGNGAAWSSATGVNAQGQQYTYAANGMITTNRPYESSGSCATLNVGASGRPADPIAKFFDHNDPAYNTTSYKDMRQALWQHARDQIGSMGPIGALTTINAKWTGSFPANPDAIVYNDGLACSSDLDFASGSAAQTVEYGSCYVPLVKRASQFRDAWNGSIQYAYYVDSQGGTRYSSEHGTHGDNPQWRNKIYNIVASSGNHSIGAAYRGDVNSAPSASGTPAMSNRSAAASDASKYAVCFGGQGASFGTTGVRYVAPQVTHVDLNVTSPQLFQVGGASNPQAVTANLGSIYCKNPNGSGEGLCSQYYALADQPTLRQLHFGVDIVGTGGYTPCVTVASTNCDFIIAKTPSRLAESRVGIDSNVTANNFSAYFYRATMPSQTVVPKLTAGDPNSKSHTGPWGEYYQPRTKISNYQTCLHVLYPDGRQGYNDCITVPLSEKAPTLTVQIPQIKAAAPAATKVISGTESAR
jgi:hypothetical protein